MKTIKVELQVENEDDEVTAYIIFPSGDGVKIYTDSEGLEFILNYLDI